MNLKIFKIKKSFKKGGLLISPGTSWKIILCVVLILILASFIFGFYLFIRTNEEFIATPEKTSGQIIIVKKERIEKVLEYFSEREKRSAEILNSPTPTIDPSL